MELNCQNILYIILYRLGWELIMIIFTICVLMATPIFLAFFFDEIKTWFVWNIVFDAIFICDIVITFFTGHYDAKTQLIVMTPKLVARYAKIAYD